MKSIEQKISKLKNVSTMLGTTIPGVILLLGSTSYALPHSEGVDLTKPELSQNHLIPADSNAVLMRLKAHQNGEKIMLAHTDTHTDTTSSSGGPFSGDHSNTHSNSHTNTPG